MYAVYMGSSERSRYYQDQMLQEYHHPLHSRYVSDSINYLKVSLC